jgi:hypothetical protein
MEERASGIGDNQQQSANLLISSSVNNLNTNTPVSSLSSFDQETTTAQTPHVTSTLPPTSANYYANPHSHSAYSSNNMTRTTLLQSYNYMNHPIYDQYAAAGPFSPASSKKQFIKVQDCSTWLSISNPKNAYQVLKSNVNGTRNVSTAVVTRGGTAGARQILDNNPNTGIGGLATTNSTTSNFYSNLNRINMLLNRRVPRVNT